MIAEYLDRSSLVARMKYYEEHTTEESGEHYAYSVALREIRNAPAADVAEVGHEDETTQIIDGCCTACGAFMDCCEAADYKFCPYCAKRVV